MRKLSNHKALTLEKVCMILNKVIVNLHTHIFECNDVEARTIKLDLRFFVAKFDLSRFTHIFCVKFLSKKSCLCNKKDKYDVWLYLGK